MTKEGDTGPMKRSDLVAICLLLLTDDIRQLMNLVGGTVSLIGRADGYLSTGTTSLHLIAASGDW
jgi:hypothetical protein